MRRKGFRESGKLEEEKRRRNVYSETYQRKSHENSRGQLWQAAELLEQMYDKWENGDPSFSESGDSLGQAFQLGDLEDKIIDVLNKLFPAPTSVLQRSQTDYDPCCAECGMNKSEHDGKDHPGGACANFTSVPQAEPPEACVWCECGHISGHHGNKPPYICATGGMNGCESKCQGFKAVTDV